MMGIKERWNWLPSKGDADVSSHTVDWFDPVHCPPGPASRGRNKPAADTRPTKIWNRSGPLGETPQHVTDAYPLSDQDNKGGWIKFEPMTRRVRGPGSRPQQMEPWHDWWKGRQPALFSDKNVTVSEGKLHLTMRKEKVPEEFEKLGYKDYTSAALHTKVRSGYGYYEVKARPMNSGGSSSFWFQVEDTPGWLTEIDVFEIGGKAPGFEQKYNMNLHVFKHRKSRSIGAWAVCGKHPGGLPTTTMFSAWTGVSTRFGTTSMAFWSVRLRTRTGTNRCS